MTIRDKTRCVLIMAVCLTVGSIRWSYAQTVKAYLKDGQIVTECGDDVQSVDLDRRDGRRRYSLNKWDVTEHADPVREALKVFKKKGAPAYKKKVWLIDKGDGTNTIVVEYVSNKTLDKLLFTPDEDFMYFIDFSRPGHSMIYGLNLRTKRQFAVTSASDFEIVTCDNRESYLLVAAGSPETRYYVFKTTGQKAMTLDGAMTLDEIKREVCY